jgi:hypothetical protein
MSGAPLDPDIRVWPALLVAPLVVLTDVSVGYSLVTPACARQGGGELHVLSVVCLLAVLAMTLLAWRTWAGLSRAQQDSGAVSGAVTGSDADHADRRARFLALMATLVGALSTLSVIAVWIPAWVLPPCS